MRKLCKACNRNRNSKSFSARSAAKDGLMAWCKDCVKKYDKKRYLSRSDKERERSKKKRKKYRETNRKKIWEYLEQNPCIDCGEKDPVVLTFDHLDDKKYNISDIVHSNS